MSWYSDLIGDVNIALENHGWDTPNSEMDTVDELEEFAAEWNKTPEGKKWAEMAASLEWKIAS